MKKKRILLTSVGRRDYLINYFKSITEYDCYIIASNSIENTSGMWIADDSYLSPPITSDEYIPYVLDLCKSEHIDLLISLFDLDNFCLAKYKEEFLRIGVLPVISDPSIVGICLDKIKTNYFLRNIGLKTTKTYTDINSAITAIENKTLSFPLILKPQWGQGSISTEIVYCKEELIAAYQFLQFNVDKTNIIYIENFGFKNSMLIQEFIPGEEYGVDCVNNLNGINKGIIVKKKLSMRAGETDKAITVFDNSISDTCRYLSDRLGHVGIMDLDLIKKDDDIYIIDMNPRFGGGYPFSHQAGANIPLAILQWSEQIEAEDVCFQYKENVMTIKGINLVSKSMITKKDISYAY